ncbi:GNAT family N-acetyltransferase [Paraferrimonas sedimenticola]|uniref:Ferrichrome ABC transporter substrate-binding protein n=1 Tax=Paraferrimonas sedimenticola TaxID=375674 RepID=A0AA37RX28_9GAMM|nr:GNAT family N-acetyltransferase [Paraferrimonas sedimenticola]GLP96676.1 ferrichrome ABC transporter substrate-binding protein [Paraferrimonas sedimenticola]
MTLSFETPRLVVLELEESLKPVEHTALIERIPEILIFDVVKDLPPYFQQINTPQQATLWLSAMLEESHLLTVSTRQGQLIGFLFVAKSTQPEAHIGYLLAKDYWGQGLASELLQGFIHTVSQQGHWQKLIGGVAKSNTASIGLLEKLGFVARPSKQEDSLFFELVIPPKYSR